MQTDETTRSFIRLFVILAATTVFATEAAPKLTAKTESTYLFAAGQRGAQYVALNYQKYQDVVTGNQTTASQVVTFEALTAIVLYLTPEGAPELGQYASIPVDQMKLDLRGNEFNFLANVRDIRQVPGVIAAECPPASNCYTIPLTVFPGTNIYKLWHIPKSAKTEESHRHRDQLGDFSVNLTVYTGNLDDSPSGNVFGIPIGDTLDTAEIRSQNWAYPFDGGNPPNFYWRCLGPGCASGGAGLASDTFIASPEPPKTQAEFEKQAAERGLEDLKRYAIAKELELWGDKTTYAN